MKRIFYILLLLSLFNNSYGQYYDLIVTTESDSIACRIDSITDTHIYFEMKNLGRWTHTHADKTDIVEYKRDAIDKRLFVFKTGTSYVESYKLQISTENKPGIAGFIELGGKGYYSANIDFRIKNNHRLSIGITELDYAYYNKSTGHSTDGSFLSPGIMYYYIAGRGPSYFELGAGMSTSYRFDLDYSPEDHILSFHGVIGYRYQKKDGFLFRTGFTPFYRPNSWFLPLFGISLGYSW